jgi:hypothetical protein
LAEEIRALLIKYYGRHVLHIVERAIDIAGEYTGWHGESPEPLRKKALAALKPAASNKMPHFPE